MSGRYDKVARISDEINSYLTEYQIPKDIANIFEIWLLEALNNIIKNACKEDFSKSINISVNIYSNKIVVKLNDTGLIGTNTSKAKLGYNSLDIENIPERGMEL